MLLKDIEENYPFISVVTYGGNEYVGIIANQDAYVTTMYVYTSLKTILEKGLFLEVGEVWWWESNRMIPINIFLKEDWIPFRPYLTTFVTKDCEIIAGPNVSLSDLSKKRTKRRSIQLIKKVD